MSDMQGPGGPPGKSPQELVTQFWNSYVSKTPGKVTSIFPRSLYADLLPPSHSRGHASSRNAAESYQAAARECKERVARIVRECQRTNEKFTDPEFDIEADFEMGNCLRGLGNTQKISRSKVNYKVLKNALLTLVESKIMGNVTSVDLRALHNCLKEPSNESRGFPGSVHRIDYIYEKPSFLVDGYSDSDIRQGRIGDCWWLAAVATLCSMPELMDKVCVDRNEECGVYGFVFFRDGEWFSTVVDDNLYLAHEDYDSLVSNIYDSSGEKEMSYKRRYQTGSDALYFAKCVDKNETWLPLLEKAYAKVHGDYDSISGGSSGEAVEDMTGGVTTILGTNRILSKEKLWQELLNVNKDFVFAVDSPYLGSDAEARHGLTLNHAYSILQAREEDDASGAKVRLVLVRNPWGERAYTGTGEWTGPWSDGSKEWTPYWMEKLGYRFGDDGRFWMSYEDMLRRFTSLYRTRLFDDKWTVVQQWTYVNVSWVTGYLNTKFSVEVKKKGPVVFLLSQLDSRYFNGLEGQYSFELHFLLQEANCATGDHIVRARPSGVGGNRSVSAEIELEPGAYEVVPKILAERNPDKVTVEKIIKQAADQNPQKLRQIGMNYDLAHTKGILERPKKKREDMRNGRAPTLRFRRRRRDQEVSRTNSGVESERPNEKKKESQDGPKEELKSESRRLKEKREKENSKEESKIEEQEGGGSSNTEMENSAVKASRTSPQAVTEECKTKAADPNQRRGAPSSENSNDTIAGKPIQSVPFDLIILKDYKVNKRGKVLDEEGREIGHLTYGDIKDTAGKKINGKGEVVDKSGKIIGNVEVTPGDAAEEAMKAVKDDSSGGDQAAIELPKDSDAACGEAGSIEDKKQGDPSKDLETNGAEENTPSTREKKEVVSPEGAEARLAAKLFPPPRSPPNPFPNETYDPPQIAHFTASDSDRSRSPSPRPRSREYANHAAQTPEANNPWNAVCVIGLRVYSMDEVKIKLVRPKDGMEGASLVVDGVTPAGATM